MNFSYILKEMLLMMAFTFVIGIALAYVIKMMTLFFPAINVQKKYGFIKQNKLWWRAYHIKILRTLRLDDNQIISLSGYKSIEKASMAVMNEMAEFHLGNVCKNKKSDAESSLHKLEEFHTGSN